ncbi:hypothetical protein [Faucicola atlantae]|nr:hypothetical protein [Moraxella atlantae]
MTTNNPFDRLLISQAIAENLTLLLTLLTVDERIAQYPMNLVD